MSACELGIVLDEPARVYAPGDQVRGRVTIAAQKDCPGASVILAARWRTHGEGDSAAGEATTSLVFPSPWPSGVRAVYPFTVPAPSGPFTYRGHSLNVDWHLEAEAALDGGEMVRAATPFAFMPRAGLPVRRHTLQPPVPLLRPTTSIRRPLIFALQLLTVVMLFPFGIGAAVSLAALVPEIDAEAWGGLIIGLLTGGIVLFRVVGRALTHWRLGAVSVESSALALRPGGVGGVRAGEAVTCTIRLRPRGPVRLDHAVVRIEAQERVTRGSGAEQERFGGTVYRAEETLAVDRIVAAGEALSLRTSLSVPVDGPCSFSAKNNELVWRLAVHLDLAGWPDWREVWPFTVHPPVEAAKGGVELPSGDGHDACDVPVAASAGRHAAAR